MSKTVRLNTEKKIEHDTFRLKIGSTNKIEPKVIYIEGRTFITPTEEKDSYGSDISSIKHLMSTSIRKNLCSSPMFDEKFIFVFDIAESGMSINKKSFLSFQFLIKQKGDDILLLKDVKEKAEPYIQSVMDDLSNGLTKYKFTASKCKKAAV